MKYYYIISLFLLSACNINQQSEVAQQNQYIRTELYFGLPAPKDSVTATWEAFADSFITPAFPDGYTILDADGRWRDKYSATTAKEKSKLLIIIYKSDSLKEKEIEKIITQYKLLFKQKAVLRVDGQVTTNLDDM